MEKLSYEALGRMLADAREDIPSKSQWRHYKGGEYIVDKLVIREAEQEVSVVYAPIEHPDIPMSRPLSEWHDEIAQDGSTVMRFTRVD